MIKKYVKHYLLSIALIGIAIGGSVQIALAAPDTNDYLFTSGFSSTQGDGQWSYMQYDGINYSNMNYDAPNSRWYGSAPYVFIGNGWAHPDVGRDAVIAWKAPKAGTISVRGTMENRSDPTLPGQSGAQGVQTWVKKQSGASISQVWPSTGPQVIPADFMTQHIFKTTVQANDILYFHLNVGSGGASFDTTSWNPHISYNFEPKFLLDKSEVVMTPADYQAAGIDHAQDTSFSTVLNPNGINLDFYHTEGVKIDATHDDTTHQKFSGTLGTPFQVKQYDATQANVFANPNNIGGNWWLSNIYKLPTGELLALCHVEHDSTGNGPWKIGLAYSTNNGTTFTKLGFIISQHEIDTAIVPRKNINGVPYVIRDGYIYAYYTDADGYMKPAVARALLTDVLTAAQGGTVSPWKKYYQGSWNENGIGGHADSVIPSNPVDDYSTHGDAAYSTYLNKNILVGFTQQSGTGKGIYLTTSDNQTDFEGPTSIKISNRNFVYTPPDTYAGEDSLSPYETIVNVDGSDNGQVGQEFYVYYNHRHRQNDNGNYRWLMRQKVTLNSAGFTKNIYDSAADFSRSHNENGWEYYEYNPATTSYVAMKWGEDNNRWKGGPQFTLIGSNWQHPDTTDSVRRWVAPKTGTITLTSATSDVSVLSGSADGVKVSVKKNSSTNVWPTTGSVTINPGVPYSFSPVNVSVTKGDTIDFIVNNGGSGNNAGDTTLWQPVITYQ